MAWLKASKDYALPCLKKFPKIKIMEGGEKLARPRKALETMSKHLTKEEIAERKEAEEALKGGADKIKPPEYLNKSQRKIFRYIVNELAEAGILTNLDIFVLENCSIAIDRIKECENWLNENGIYTKEAKDIVRTKESYIKDFLRYCNELSLSPQSRAKLAGLNIQAKSNKEDPVLKAIRGEDIE